MCQSSRQPQGHSGLRWRPQQRPQKDSLPPRVQASFLSPLAVPPPGGVGTVASKSPVVFQASLSICVQQARRQRQSCKGCCLSVTGSAAGRRVSGAGTRCGCPAQPPVQGPARLCRCQKLKALAGQPCEAGEGRRLLWTPRPSRHRPSAPLLAVAESRRCPTTTRNKDSRGTGGSCLPLGRKAF